MQSPIPSPKPDQADAAVQMLTDPTLPIGALIALVLIVGIVWLTRRRRRSDGTVHPLCRSAEAGTRAPNIAGDEAEPQASEYCETPVLAFATARRRRDARHETRTVERDQLTALRSSPVVGLWQSRSWWITWRRPQRDQAQQPAAPLVGRAWVIDGDTIIVRRTKIRIKAIDAPELGTRAGHAAKWYLHRLLRGQVVHCHPTGEVSYDRLVAWCETREGDLGRLMIEAGHATRIPQFDGGRYAGVKCRRDH